jgi:rubredoxin
MKKLIWVKSARSESWACSECAWAFNPSGPPRGASLDAMKENFERQRDTEFASHVCAKHPRTKGHEL